MKPFARKITSFFLLLLFLFPLVAKGLHDFEHRHDFHCAEIASKHFHQLEHDCSLCDYQAPVSGDSHTDSDTFVLLSETVLLDAPVIASADSPLFYRLSSRGPPVQI